MATSAQTLASIIETLAKKYDFEESDAITFLAAEELLPKKLIPKEVNTVTAWASKRAEEVGTAHGIVPNGPGSGKNGKWTLADVEKAMAKPVKEKLLISPVALNLANDNGLDLTGKTGSGKDGRILVKDVESWLAENDDTEELNISPRALQEAKDAGIKDEVLETIHGSGKDGRILLEDIKKHMSASEEDSDDED